MGTAIRSPSFLVRGQKPLTRTERERERVSGNLIELHVLFMKSEYTCT